MQQTCFRQIWTADWTVSTGKIWPGVIVLDHNLNEDKSGGELCIDLKADPSTKDIPVVMLSADDQLPVLAKNSGADPDLKKPFDIGTLYRLIKQVTLTEAARNPPPIFNPF